MAKKTGLDVEQDIFNLIVASTLPATILGTLFKDGVRPSGVKTEDAVVSFLTGMDDSFQTGQININVFVPFTDNGGDVMVKDVARCMIIESMLNSVTDALVSTEYLLEPAMMIQTFDIPDVEQNLVNCRLHFSRLSI